MLISWRVSEQSIDPTKNLSVVLVIPDLYDRNCVRNLVDVLLVQMGFRQLCAQQVRQLTIGESQSKHLLRNRWRLLMEPVSLVHAWSILEPRKPASHAWTRG